MRNNSWMRWRSREPLLTLPQGLSFSSKFLRRLKNVRSASLSLAQPDLYRVLRSLC
ncbi:MULTISPECIES: hypothetical protein [Aerosakkonema]|uniref:hypothetical protein n=1 Tax=Aerosakkonema TaxID=1246629 RepID=UPI0035BA2AD6